MKLDILLKLDDIVITMKPMRWLCRPASGGLMNTVQLRMFPVLRAFVWNRSTLSLCWLLGSWLGSLVSCRLNRTSRVLPWGNLNSALWASCCLDVSTTHLVFLLRMITGSLLTLSIHIGKVWCPWKWGIGQGHVFFFSFCLPEKAFHAAHLYILLDTKSFFPFLYFTPCLMSSTSSLSLVRINFNRSNILCKSRMASVWINFINKESL